MRALPFALFVVLIAAVIALSGCPKPSPDAANTPPVGPNNAPTPKADISGELLIYVPCGVAGPYGAIKDLFEQRYPNVTVKQDVANIDVHTGKIADGKGAPDVFISLGDREVERVAKADRIDGEPVTFAYNSIAMMVANKNPCGIESFEDLKKPEVKTIAVPSNQNSSGFYAEQAFKKAGVWDAIQDKLWRTDEPSQVKVQLSSGKADVGIVYYPCTRETREVGGKPQEMKGKVQLLGKIPTDLSGPIPAQAAVIKGCKNPEAGKAFLDMMMEDEVQDIWEKWAFDRAKQPASGERVTLYLYCGAGIRPFMDKAIEAFCAKNKGVRIDVGYAGSGCLLGQLTFAKRGDLYMPGEEFYMDQARKRGFIDGETELVGYFEPILLVQKGNPKNIQKLEDVVKPGIRLGVGEPDAAAIGLVAESILTKAGLLEQAQKNIVMRAGNVPELGYLVKLKSLDVSIVWRMTAKEIEADTDIVPIPETLSPPIAIPIGVLKFSEHKDVATRFVDWIAGPEGQKLAEESWMLPAND